MRRIVSIFLLLFGFVWGSDGAFISSEHFDIQVEYSPKSLRPGYVFQVTLIPHTDVALKSIRKNFYFLLDRSSSIPLTRFNHNKCAVCSALHLLKPGDRFNILVFDDHVVRFQPSAVEWSDNTLAGAHEFIEKLGHRGFFAATELYASLGKIIPQSVSDEEINIAILLSDGDTYLSREKQRLTIAQWTAHNQGKVTLYALASGRGNNLALLDLLSAFNKGDLVYAYNHRAVSQTLTNLMGLLQNPIGKEISVSAMSEDKGMMILLQPKPSRMPDLYQNRPLVIYGSTNKLSDFELVIQGKCYDQEFEIKKTVSFENAKVNTYSVERNWTQLLVQEFYERYFVEGNSAHLESARQLLSPLNLPTPFLN